MIRRLIIFLIRMRLGLKKYQDFRFDNQKSKTDSYYFDSYNLIKMECYKGNFNLRKSSVSLNWLLNDNCRIHKIKREDTLLHSYLWSTSEH